MSSPSRLPHPPPSASYTRDTHKRREEHKARTGNDHEESYILTLHTNREHHMLLTSLRDKYFPPKINKLAAHIALFRALPGSQLPRLEHDIASITQSRASFSILANKPFRMRQGVGIHVRDDTGGLKSVYEELKAQWTSFLSQQDRSFAPHYTVQNQVADDAIVDQTLRELMDQFHGSHGQALGLSLYRYERGYWKKIKDFMFEKESSA